MTATESNGIRTFTLAMVEKLLKTAVAAGIGIAYVLGFAASMAFALRLGLSWSYAVAFALQWPVLWPVVGLAALAGWVRRRPYRIRTRLAWRLLGPDWRTPSMEDFAEILSEPYSSWCGRCCKHGRPGYLRASKSQWRKLYRWRNR